MVQMQSQSKKLTPRKNLKPIDFFNPMPSVSYVAGKRDRESSVVKHQKMESALNKHNILPAAKSSRTKNSISQTNVGLPYLNRIARSVSPRKTIDHTGKSNDTSVPNFYPKINHLKCHIK